MWDIHIVFNDSFPHSSIQVGHFNFVRLRIRPIKFLIDPIYSQAHRLPQSINLNSQIKLVENQHKNISAKVHIEMKVFVNLQKK